MSTGEELLIPLVPSSSSSSASISVLVADDSEGDSKRNCGQLTPPTGEKLLLLVLLLRTDLPLPSSSSMTS